MQLSNKKIGRATFILMKKTKDKGLLNGTSKAPFCPFEIKAFALAPTPKVCACVCVDQIEKLIGYHVSGPSRK